jgi:hypothetical protein
MNVVLVNLSNQGFAESRGRLNASARKNGIQQILSYDFEDIKSSAFYHRNKAILDEPRGSGLWLWKPYIVQEALRQATEGDIVIYCDAGIEIIADLAPVISICSTEQPVMLFGNCNFLNSHWTKRDAFVLMNGDSPEYWSSLQCDAAFGVFRKSKEADSFIGEWLHFAEDDRILSDKPNTCGLENLPGFIEHRFDQSVLSLLAHKHQLPLYRMPSQFGNHYKMPAYRVAGEYNTINQLIRKQVRSYADKSYTNSPYGQLLDHHRGVKNDQGKKKGLAELLTWFINGVKGRIRRIFRNRK